MKVIFTGGVNEAFCSTQAQFVNAPPPPNPETLKDRVGLDVLPEAQNLWVCV